MSDTAVATIESVESSAPEKIVRGSWTRAQRKRLVERACCQIAQGISLTRWCRSDPALPAVSTMVGWMLDDEDTLAMYLRAEQIACVVLGQQLMDFAQHDEETDNVVRVSRAKLVVETAKWKLARILPKMFGDRMNVEHSGNVTITLDTGIRRGESITATRDAETREVSASLIDSDDERITESASTSASGSLLD